MFAVTIDQLADTLVFKGWVGDQKVFESAFAGDDTFDDGRLRVGSKKPLGKAAPDTAHPDAVVVDDGFEGGDVARFHLVVEPTSCDIEKTLTMKEAIDSDHRVVLSDGEREGEAVLFEGEGLSKAICSGVGMSGSKKDFDDAQGSRSFRVLELLHDLGKRSVGASEFLGVDGTDAALGGFIFVDGLDAVVHATFGALDGRDTHGGVSSQQRGGR